MDADIIEPGKQYIRLSRVTEITDLSRASIWRRIRVGDFPAPIKLSSNCARWDLGAIQAWFRKKEAEAEVKRAARNPRGLLSATLSEGAR